MKIENSRPAVENNLQPEHVLNITYKVKSQNKNDPPPELTIKAEILSNEDEGLPSYSARVIINEEVFFASIYATQGHFSNDGKSSTFFKALILHISPNPFSTDFDNDFFALPLVEINNDKHPSLNRLLRPLDFQQIQIPGYLIQAHPTDYRALKRIAPQIWAKTAAFQQTAEVNLR